MKRGLLSPPEEGEKTEEKTASPIEIREKMKYVYTLFSISNDTDKT